MSFGAAFAYTCRVNHRLPNTCSRKAAQSTKLIVLRYDALFKSELTANKKLSRWSDKAKHSTIGIRT